MLVNLKGWNVLKPLSYHKGVSLIELVVGIAILGIVVGLGVPSYKAWIQNTQIRSAAESIQNGIQLARAEAVKRNASVQFDLRGTSAAWVVCLRPAAPGNCANPDDANTIQSRSAKEGASTNITIASTDAMPLVFNSFGAVTSPAPSAADGLIRLTVDVSTSVLSAAESRELKILVGAGGNTRMCDPATTLPTSDPRKCP